MSLRTNPHPEMLPPLPPRGSQALTVLRRGGLVLLPTANLWQLITTPEHPETLHRLLRICPPSPTLRPELVFPDIETLRQWCPLLHPRLDTLLAFHRRALTLLVPAGPRVPLSLVDGEGMVAVRLVMDSFCYRLCEDTESPLVAMVARGQGESVLPTRFGLVRSDVLREAGHTVQRRQREELGSTTTVTVRMRGDEIEFVE